jgi:hypothetical protein
MSAGGITSQQMKGDLVEVVVDVGGAVERFEIEATKAGRRVEISTSRAIVEVAELTRTGRAVRTGRFMASRVVALVEHPARGEGEVRSSPRSKAPRNQESFPIG